MTGPETGAPPPTGRILWSGLKGRCPRCGSGRLFERYLKITDKCRTCGLGFIGHDVGDGPVVPAILILGGAICGAAWLLERTFAPPLWLHAVLWAPMAVASTFAILPPLKGLAVALQYRFRSTEEETPPGGT